MTTGYKGPLTVVMLKMPIRQNCFLTNQNISLKSCSSQFLQLVINLLFDIIIQRLQMLVKKAIFCN